MDTRRQKIRDFIDRWKDTGNEDEDTQSFWEDLLSTIFDIEDTYGKLKCQKKVLIDGTNKKIDIYIPETKVLIEQKSHDKSLDKKYEMSDGVKRTPYEQADFYARHMNHNEHPRFIITCNFQEIRIYDNNKRNTDYETIYLRDLEKEYTRLQFLIKPDKFHIKKEEELSVQAGKLVGKIYDALLEQYKDPTSKESLESLNILIVRLVFLLYAEDAGIFEKQQFLNFIENYKNNPNAFRRALIDLFNTLDTPENERDFYDDDLDSFPYVNGGLFNKNKKIEIPRFNQEIIDLIINEGSIGFNWSGISPTIFGAVFESTLNPETRRSGGMHYTSLENIHKVIDPLFLDEYKKKLKEAISFKTLKSRSKHVEEFRDELAQLKFLDPACGSGNFLTETYLSLRRLENEAIASIYSGQYRFGEANPIKVNLNQFYGIEINDFAVAVANTALFISEYQMLKETELIIGQDIDFLPLKTFDGIHEGDALTINWNNIVPANECNYIMGNPPYIGYSYQTKRQKETLKNVYSDEKGKPYPRSGKIDYVSGWFFKAAEYIQNTDIKVAFVATNSIVQGDQVEPIWNPIISRYKIHIDFAYLSFAWINDVKDKANVYCVIIGFSSCPNKKPKYLFDKNSKKEVKEINFYLKEYPAVLVKSRTEPISFSPTMKAGNRPADGGKLIIEEKDYIDFIKKEPKAKKYIKKLIGSDEFLHNKNRYCLWLVGISPNEINSMPEVKKRIQLCKENRLNGAKDRVKLAQRPHLFRETFNPESALIIPKVSTNRREYIPMDFIDKNIITTDLNFIIENADLYHFGILSSKIHFNWMDFVSGRLGEGFRYSKKIVYNNFPWPNPTEKQIQNIKNTANNILEARKLYPKASLSDLYDPDLMPIELRKAHEVNDRAVMEAYGFNSKLTEFEVVSELIKLYKKLTQNEE